MSSLGVYFGPRVISIVETKGKKLINNIRLLQSAILGSDLEEKVPEELKLVALFKDELRKNKIEAKEVAIALSGKDLIIRTFEMPGFLPRDELKNNAVNFEAKKYIPFKIEDLISDFQLELDKSSRRNLILFVGIKKETLNKYLSVFSQLGLKIDSIEYSAFSLLRLLKLANVREKGIVAVFGIDLTEEDEVNFVVLENGFPLFSRDITSMGGPTAVPRVEEVISGMDLERLKTEIRISLDYYHRKFPTKNIKNVIFITGQDYRLDLETFAKEIGLDTQFLDTSNYIDKPVPFSLSFIKSYSSSLLKVINTPIKINLLSVKTTTTTAAEEIYMEAKASHLFTGLKVEPKIAILGLLICIAFFTFGLHRAIPLHKQLRSITRMMPKVSAVRPDAAYEELMGIDSEYKKKMDTIDDFIKKRLYLTTQLDVIARVIPEGMWLTDFSFKKEEDKTELIIQGTAYLADSDKELEQVNAFLSQLKQNSAFAEYFKEMNIVSVDHSKIEDASVTNFVISCRGYKGR